VGCASVLVVDDDKQVRVALKKVFGRAGYEGVAAASGEEALELMENQEFDLVVAAIVLGGMSGIELLERIKSKNKDVPVVLVTAFSSEEFEEQAKADGVYAYLRKPVGRDEIIKIAREAIASTA